MRRIDYSQVAQAASGVHGHEIVDGELRFSRFSSVSLDFWRSQGDFARIRSCCSAGVTLSFRTDSDVISLCATLQEGARSSGTLDVWADGCFAGVVGGENPGECVEGSVVFSGRREREITVYLPHSRACRLQELALADGATFAPLPRKRILLALGDSITQGMDSVNPSQIYAATLARQLGLEQVNQAIGGWVFSADSLPEAPCAAPALITVAFGTNDYSKGASLEHIGRYLARVRELYPTTPLAVLSPIFRLEEGIEGPQARMNSGGYTLGALRAELRRAAAATSDCHYLGHRLLIPAEAYFYKDLIHPNTLGHGIYGANVARLIRDLNLPL